VALSFTLATTGVHLLHARSTSPTARLVGIGTSVPKYLVLMVLDGARPDYFGLTPLPHVDQLRAGGTQFTRAVAGILEAETPTGHATIATGSRPDQDGILGFDWGNDDDSRYSLFSPEQMGSLEQILQDNHAPTIAGLYKQQFPRARVVALSGHKYYAAAPLGGPNADAIMYYQGNSKGQYVPVAVPGHVPPAGVLDAPEVIAPTTHSPTGGEDHLATRLAMAAVNKMHPRLLLINYPEFDWPLGHVDGGILDRAKIITAMRGFDADLGTIEDRYRQAGILDQTMFVITADHGMMPITRFVPSSVAQNAINAAGTTATDIASNSGDYIWLSDPTRAQTVAANIMSAGDPGVQSAYYLATVGAKHQYLPADRSAMSPSLRAAYRYLLKGLLNGHEPAVVVFGREGTSFSDPQSNWKADHGGGSWQSQHVPLILEGPGIQTGVMSTVPAQLDDIAPTVLTAMGVRPIGMEGHVLTQALDQPADAAGQARAAEVQHITRVVNGLVAAQRDKRHVG
jgi:hypothetical protein